MRLPSRSEGLTVRPPLPVGGSAVVAAAVLVFGGCSRHAEGGASRAEGARLYDQNCSTCHGLDGRGAPPAYPPLAGRVPALLREPRGRTYLVSVPVSGLAGPIADGDDHYDGVMAPFSFRSDAELAAILNHACAAWGNDALLPPGHRSITAGEVALARKQGGTGHDVWLLRPQPKASGRPSQVTSQ